MILKKEYNIIINKFKNQMKDLGKKITILLPSGEKKFAILKNLNFDGSILIKSKDREENIFSARIINDSN